MRINHNIAAMNAHRSMESNSEATSKSMQKLSTGMRINSAADDAAGLGISEKMRGQIRGLDRASQNAQDGISMVQTAEGALNEDSDILQRMRELSVQSASDTNTDQDRQNIQSEMSQLGTEIDRIGNTTQFNGKNLLDGSMGKAVNTAVANIQTGAVLKDAGAASAPITGASLATNLQDSNGNSLGIAVGDTISMSYVKNGTTVTNSLVVGAATKVSDIQALVTDGTASVSAGGNMIETATTAGTAGAVNGLTVSVSDTNGNVRQAATNTLSSFNESTAAADVRTDGRATILIGANSNQNISIDIGDMRSGALGVAGLQVTTQGQANTAIKVIDSAIQKVSAQRGNLGAYENRLDHTINNLGASSENLSSAESRIRDTDMAAEQMNFTKNNILSQEVGS